jgi:hypothetical protein
MPKRSEVMLDDVNQKIRNGQVSTSCWVNSEYNDDMYTMSVHVGDPCVTW